MLTLNALTNPKNKLRLEIVFLGLLTIIGIMIFGVTPALLMVEDFLIQIIGIGLLIGLSFTIIKIIKLLENGIIVEIILEKLFK